MINHRRPSAGEYAPFYKSYIKQVSEIDFLAVLNADFTRFLSWWQSLSDDQWQWKYAPDKWTVKEVMQHLLDTERIFAYRALRIARNDQTPLPGFEENAYVLASQANRRIPESFIQEYTWIRKSTIALFSAMDNQMLNQRGVASNSPVSVRALGFMIAGHERHHHHVLKERYGI